MPTIYRVEHKENRVGPYRQAWKSHNEDPEVKALTMAINDAHRCRDEFPTPVDEGYEILRKGIENYDNALKEEGDRIVTLSSDWPCGFDSVESLKKWFHGWRSKLRRVGFVMTVWEVDEDDFIALSNQVIFDKEKATLKKEVRIP